MCCLWRPEPIYLRLEGGPINSNAHIKLLNWLRDSFVGRYLVAVGAVLLLVPPAYPLFELFAQRFPLQYFLIAVVVAAGNGGFGPGVLATVLGALAGQFLFLPGRGQGV